MIELRATSRTLTSEIVDEMLRSLCLIFIGVALALAAYAQDTQFRPRDQQIPPPDCMNLHHAWEGLADRLPAVHARALAARPRALAHGTPHPHRLRSFALRHARTSLDAVELHAAADDGARSLLLRSGRRPLHRRSLSRRSRKALWRHRCRADLVDLSEHGHRRSQSAARWSSPCPAASRACGRWSPTFIAAACACSSP